jgi:anti-sigma regulatory factor (Ser/Thr protein kinase)
MVPIIGWSHETILAAEPISAALAREFVCQHLVAHHLVHLVEDVRLVVSELATNAVAHARTEFVVTLASANGSVLLAIQDGSPSPPVRSAPDVMDMSGRGLMIVELVSQAWGTRTDAHGFKSVWASFPSGPDQLESDPFLA